MNDMVNHPQHYISQNGLEVIDVIEEFTSDLKGLQAVCTANAIKYILRWPYKGNPKQDLQKAQWYISKLISTLEDDDE